MNPRERVSSRLERRFRGEDSEREPTARESQNRERERVIKRNVFFFCALFNDDGVKVREKERKRKT